ncbi:MAG: hypothetical protein BYD32DRAFT_440348 [Podila humilis]|nr:MAG: hypothetical protein BYD32DRAFT_440348 [Podila humilis]
MHSRPPPMNEYEAHMVINGPTSQLRINHLVKLFNKRSRSNPFSHRNRSSDRQRLRYRQRQKPAKTDDRNHPDYTNGHGLLYLPQHQDPPNRPHLILAQYHAHRLSPRLRRLQGRRHKLSR